MPAAKKVDIIDDAERARRRTVANLAAGNAVADDATEDLQEAETGYAEAAYQAFAGDPTTVSTAANSTADAVLTDRASQAAASLGTLNDIGTDYRTAMSKAQEGRYDKAPIRQEAMNYQLEQYNDDLMKQAADRAAGRSSGGSYRRSGGTGTGDGAFVPDFGGFGDEELPPPPKLYPAQEEWLDDAETSGNEAGLNWWYSNANNIFNSGLTQGKTLSSVAIYAREQLSQQGFTYQQITGLLAPYMAEYEGAYAAAGQRAGGRPGGNTGPTGPN